MKTKLSGFILHVSLPIVFGGLIYVCWRDPNLLMFKWFYAVGLESLILRLRFATLPTKAALPFWFIYSLPDGLWVYALTAFMILLWRDVKSLPIKMFWLSLGLLLGAGSELGQLAGIVPGVFDKADLAVCVIAPVAAFLLTSHKLLLKGA
jgi:hypothetical protein